MHTEPQVPCLLNECWSISDLNVFRRYLGKSAGDGFTCHNDLWNSVDHLLEKIEIPNVLKWVKESSTTKNCLVLHNKTYMFRGHSI